MEAARDDMLQQHFKAIIFDYDGTLCPSQRKEVAPVREIADYIIKLVEAGIIVGVASGRGGSMQDALKKVIPKAMWPDIHVGLYNGGCRTRLDKDILGEGKSSEFISHVSRIVRRLQSLGAPIVDIRPTPPYQVSVRFREGIATEPMWFVLADALREAGLDLYRMVRSKHSIDVLEVNVNKSLLVADIIQQ
ncbi:MAG: HAD hydrolase family protein, partial [Methylotenera sp.]